MTPRNLKSVWAEYNLKTLRLTGKTIYASDLNEAGWVRLDIRTGIMLKSGTKKFSEFACINNKAVEVPEDLDLKFLTYISPDAWPELEAIDFKWTAIPWLPLDIPRIEPDDWDLFWKLWNEKVSTVGSINIGRNGELKSNPLWQGLCIWKNPEVDPTKFNYPHQLFDDWEAHFPNMFKTIKECLPYLSLEKILLWQNINEIEPHFDPDLQLWPWPESMRVMLWDSNDSPTFYMTKWPERTSEFDMPLITNRTQGRGYGFKSERVPDGGKMYVNLPPETNSFVFNNGAFVHGADLAKPKIIMVIKGRPKIYEWLKVLESSYEKYKHLIPDCRLKKDEK